MKQTCDPKIYTARPTTSQIDIYYARIHTEDSQILNVNLNSEVTQMTVQPDFSLSPYPNEPLYIQTKQASAAHPASFFWRLLAFLGPNYLHQPVKSTNRAKIVRFHHLPERTVDAYMQLPSTNSSFIDFFSIPKRIPETWLLVIELPAGARLVAQTTESCYKHHKNNPNQHISVDYRLGRFDGIPCLIPIGDLFRPPSVRNI